MANSVKTLGDHELRIAMDLVHSEPNVDVVVFGQVYSKANSRLWTGRKSIKSDGARAYEKMFAAQVPMRDTLLDGIVMAAIHIDYPSRRQDLDESLVLDLLQGRFVKNDRQIRFRFVTHGLNKEKPSCRIRLWLWPT